MQENNGRDGSPSRPHTQDNDGRLGEASLPIAREILRETQAALGEAWDRLTPDERELIGRAVERAAVIAWQRVSGKHVDPADVAHIRAQLANVKSVGARLASDAVFEAVGRVLGVAARVFVERI